MKMAKKILDFCIVINFCVMFVGLFYILYLQFYTPEIFEMEGDGIVQTKEIKQGGDFVFLPNFHRLQVWDTDVNCWYRDSLKFYEPTIHVASGKMGEDTNRPITKKLPTGLLPDTYVYECEFIVPISPFRTITYHWQTEPFTII